MKQRILDNHGINSAETNGRIIAIEVNGHETDITDMSYRQLREWLGY